MGTSGETDEMQVDAKEAQRRANGREGDFAVCLMSNEGRSFGTRVYVGNIYRSKTTHILHHAKTICLKDPNSYSVAF